MEGSVIFVKASDKFEVLAKNKLDDGLQASLAFANGRIYLRGEKQLWSDPVLSARARA